MNERLKQPRGVFWGGKLTDQGTIASEVRYKMTPVAKIVEIFLENKGNLQKTADMLNDEADRDDFLYIEPEEIIGLVQWASDNQVIITTKVTRTFP